LTVQYFRTIPEVSEDVNLSVGLRVRCEDYSLTYCIIVIFGSGSQKNGVLQLLAVGGYRIYLKEARHKRPATLLENPHD